MTLAVVVLAVLASTALVLHDIMRPPARHRRRPASLPGAARAAPTTPAPAPEPVRIAPAPAAAAPAAPPAARLPADQATTSVLAQLVSQAEEDVRPEAARRVGSAVALLTITLVLAGLLGAGIYLGVRSLA